jgi:hypothetical protein
VHWTFAEHWVKKGLPDQAKRKLYDIGEVFDVAVDDVVIEADQHANRYHEYSCPDIRLLEILNDYRAPGPLAQAIDLATSHCRHCRIVLDGPESSTAGKGAAQ